MILIFYDWIFSLKADIYAPTSHFLQTKDLQYLQTKQNMPTNFHGYITFDTNKNLLNKPTVRTSKCGLKSLKYASAMYLEWYSQCNTGIQESISWIAFNKKYKQHLEVPVLTNIIRFEMFYGWILWLKDNCMSYKVLLC